MGFNTIDLNNINLDYDNFNKDDPESVLTCQTWIDKFKQRKACKKEVTKELMPVAWHPTRCWGW